MAGDGFVDALCGSARGLQILFVASVVSLAVLLASLTVVEPGSATYVIVMVQLVSFGAVLALTGTALAMCIRWT